MTTALVAMHMPLAKGCNGGFAEPVLPPVPEFPVVPELLLPPVLPLVLPLVPVLPLVLEPEPPLKPTGPVPLVPPPPDMLPSHWVLPAQISASSAWLTSTPVAQAAALSDSNAAPADAQDQVAPRAAPDKRAECSIVACSEPRRCTMTSLIPQPQYGGSHSPCKPHLGRVSGWLRAATPSAIWRQQSAPGGVGERELEDRAVQIGVSTILIRCTRALQRPVLLLALCAASACGAKKHPPAAGSVEGPGLGLGGSSGHLDNGSGGKGGAAGSAAMAGSAGRLSLGGAGGSAGSGPVESGCIPRQECQTFCAAFGNDPTSCGLGTASQCGCICEERFNGPCPEELAALLSCTGATPSVDCARHGRIFDGCESPSFDLELCDFRAREELCARAYPRCLPYCEAAVLSFCPLGTESVTSCLCGCEASLIARCESQFNAFMACSADAPIFTCDGTGRQLASGCLSEWQALDTCVNGTPPDAGD